MSDTLLKNGPPKQLRRDRMEIFGILFFCSTQRVVNFESVKRSEQRTPHKNWKCSTKTLVSDHITDHNHSATCQTFIGRTCFSICH